MLERSADATEALCSSREEDALGIERQDASSDGVRVALRGLPTRTITILHVSGRPTENNALRRRRW